MNEGTVYRLAAFTEDPAGGNPAGVWVGDELPDAAFMQATAAAIGYSETAFVAPRNGSRRSVRYYSPEAEVSFCGHATIASGIVLGRLHGSGEYVLETTVGDVPVAVREVDGRLQASLTSVEPRYEVASPELLDTALAALHWERGELDAGIQPVRAYAGAWHLVIAVADKDRLERLNYDFDGLKALMLRHGLTTLQLIWRESAGVLHARNPFPVGGVVEDPATGAAAAALGGYFRDAGLVPLPAELTIHQGVAMGRPSLLRVTVPERGGIVVSGTAADL